MSDLRIHIKIESLSVRASGVTSGIIYTDCRGELFPGPDWYDAPIVLISWWINSLKQFDYHNKLLLDFMEGDQSIEISAQSQSGWIKFFRNGNCRRNIEIKEIGFFLEELKTEIIRSAAILIDSGISGYAETNEVEQILHYLEGNQ